MATFVDQINTVPCIFEGVNKTIYTPEGIEQAQSTFNEEGLYQAISCFAKDWHIENRKKARLLDLCSSTGLCAWRVSKVIPVESVTLVDIDSKYLSVGTKHFQDANILATYCEDAVSFNKGKTYDLILMNSSYHHIEDSKKVVFLKNAAKLLSDNGKILVGDNFLPNYSTREDFKQSVVIFYTCLLEELENRDSPQEAINVIRKSAYNCWQGIEEYKVSFSIFQNHIRKSKLRISEINQVWTKDINNYQGNYTEETWGSLAMSIDLDV
jgi:ubiquinone/menaquinone biosynthesis C-methylase UbiE